MTDHAILWIIFVLLFVTLALVIVTARRGPWEGRITSGANHFTELRVDSPTQVTLGRKRRWWKPWS